MHWSSLRYLKPAADPLPGIVQPRVLTFSSVSVNLWIGAVTRWPEQDVVSFFTKLRLKRLLISRGAHSWLYFSGVPSYGCAMHKRGTQSLLSHLLIHNDSQIDGTIVLTCPPCICAFFFVHDKYGIKVQEDRMHRHMIWELLWVT